MEKKEDVSLPDNPGNPEVIDIIYTEVLKIRGRLENFLDNDYSETKAKLAAVDGKQKILITLVTFVLGCLGIPIIF